MLNLASSYETDHARVTDHRDASRRDPLSLLQYFSLARRLGMNWDAWDRAASNGSPCDQIQITDLLVAAQALVLDLEPAKPTAIPYSEIESRRAEAIQQCRVLLVRARDILELRRPWLVRWRRIIFSGVLASWIAMAMVAYVWTIFSAESGVDVFFYNRPDFSFCGGRWVEHQISKDYGPDRPHPLTFSKNFSVRWEGYLNVPKDSIYSFYLQSIGGSRLFIDDTLIVDHWASHQWTFGKHAEAFLASGVHRIVLEHHRSGDMAAIRLKWAGGGIPSNTVVGAPYLLRHLPPNTGPGT